MYGVTVPDIPGCYSYDENIDQAVQNTKEAICCNVALLLELNEPVNISSSGGDELSKIQNIKVVSECWSTLTKERVLYIYN